MGLESNISHFLQDALKERVIRLAQGLRLLARGRSERQHYGRRAADSRRKKAALVGGWVLESRKLLPVEFHWDLYPSSPVFQNFKQGVFGFHCVTRE